ncbi:hypothetical protein EVAR_10129_1 [Eumeta japonica]|uniref:Uncharacterized protein n=1 Tax=Eumeta variegata TaxID=151549 RepID=A0A4C1UCC8_EUMVA|nr:hypothetical protein EVAR_10129_1 [Eumeta japonica]
MIGEKLDKTSMHYQTGASFRELLAMSASATFTVVCGRCFSSTRTHRPMEWKRDRSFHALARTLGSGGTRQ